MDIDQEISNLIQSSKTPRKTNIIVMGGKRNGKTTLIKTFFETFNSSPKTNFLVDSVKIWESLVYFREEEHDLSLIEMDIEPKALEYTEKFQNFLKGRRNFLLFLVNTTDASFFKNQSRMIQFFEKFSQIRDYFSGCTVVWNNFNLGNKKKEPCFTYENYENYFDQVLNLRTLFTNLVCFDVTMTNDILNYLLEEREITPNPGTMQYENNNGDWQEELEHEINNEDVVMENKDSQDLPVIPDTNTVQRVGPGKSSAKNKNKIFKISKIKKNKQKSKNSNENVNEPSNTQLDLGVMQENNSNINLDLNNESLDLDEGNSNDSESVTGNSKTNPNSLISISKEVHNYLKESVESKGSSVTEYILKQLKKSQTNLSFKNIQRRVYDAINVMTAVGILHKEKNNLFFRGRMSSDTSVKGKNNGKGRHHARVLREKVRQKRNAINSKQYELIGLCSKFHLSQKLVSLNKNDSKRKFTSERLGYPFTLIKTTNESNFIIKQDDFNSRLCILSDRPYEIIYEDQIVKMLLKEDLNNVKNGLRMRIPDEPNDYIIKHHLLEKYFNNQSNFNTNNTSLREGFNTFNQKNLNVQRSPVYGLDNSYLHNSDKIKKQSIDFLIRKAFADEGSSSVSNYDLMAVDNNNFNNFPNNPFDFSDRNDFMESGLGTNQISTNFFSKFLRSGDENK